MIHVTGSCFPSGMQQHCDNAPEGVCSSLEEEEEEEVIALNYLSFLADREN